MSSIHKRSTRRGRVAGAAFAAALFCGATFFATAVASAEFPVIDLDDVTAPYIPEDEIRFFDFCPNGHVNDCDGDGLSDDTEYSLGTSPLLVDTDNDGWRDHAEVQLGTDPLDASS